MPVSDMKRITMKVKLSDTIINVMMDQAFRGEYLLTPTPHSHPYYELLCTVEGTLELGFVDGTSVTMPQHSVCVLPPNLYHRTFSSANDVKKLAIQFNYHQTEDSPASVYSNFHDLLSRMKKPCFFISSDVCEQMQRICCEMRGNLAETELMRELLTAELFVKLMRILKKSEEQSENDNSANDNLNRRYVRIDHYLSQNWMNNITADDLADEMDLSRRQLDRIFMEIYKMSFRMKLIEMRLSIAAHLLETSDIKIEDIASQVGYSTPSGFYMAFKKHYGMSAAEYRKFICQNIQ